ncbi:hypothetical protein A33I_18205 [Alkalihalophilus marmarensis DSM 21297]|uniref:Uncharacterized protein n=1 Tax=Alkalihalophilus marmarensis DSM 21297 TaxID=1188261 RepID=U6SN23_9BACI|nr:hypothetical protein A33I_18205 [Alkalihalophilus marmarensis DSM 21297]
MNEEAAAAHINRLPDKFLLSLAMNKQMILRVTDKARAPIGICK